jgi:hypothetical protein
LKINNKIHEVQAFVDMVIIEDNKGLIEYYSPATLEFPNKVEFKFSIERTSMILKNTEPLLLH